MKKFLLTAALASSFLMGSALAHSTTGLTIRNDSMAPITFLVHDADGEEGNTAVYRTVNAFGTLQIDSSILPANYTISLCWVDPKDKHQTDCHQTVEGYPYVEVPCDNNISNPRKVYVFGGYYYVGHNDPRSPRFVKCFN